MAVNRQGGLVSLGNQQVMERLSFIEDEIQELRFTYMAKLDATTYGLGVLYRQQNELKHELTGFRAEATAHIAALQTDMAEVKADVAGLKTDVKGLKADVVEVKADVREGQL